MLEQPIDSIDEATLMRLVENQVSERRDLEFKRDLPGGKDDDVKEFLADISSFANTQGGDLIYGIAEENGVAAELPGVQTEDHNKTILGIDQRLQSGIDPRLIGVRTRWVPLANGRGAIVLRVPGSLSAPHRVSFKNSGRFWGRNSCGKYEMDVRDLRHAFTQSAQLPQQFRQLHADAVAMAKGVDMPFAVATAPTAVITVAPLGLFREDRSIPITRDQAVVPVRVGGFSAVDTIEGVLAHAPVDREAGTVGSFALTHRTGRTDAAWVIGGVRLGNDNRELRLVWAPIFEQGLRSMATATQMQLRQFGIEGPWVVLTTVFGVKGHMMILGDGYGTNVAFRDEVLLGQYVIETIDEAALMPTAEAFWLLFGENRPKNRALGQER